jgi:hypothetical protein
MNAEKNTNQKKKIAAPRQKTFYFSRGVSEQRIDATINLWLLTKAASGVLPTVGKVSVGVFRTVYVYLYLEQIEV